MTLITGFTCPPTIYFKFITKCDKCYYKVRQLFLLQSSMVCYYKVRQLFYYKVRPVLSQSATGITKCDDYYKMRQYSIEYFIDSKGERQNIKPLSTQNNWSSDKTDKKLCRSWKYKTRCRTKRRGGQGMAFDQGASRPQGTITAKSTGAPQNAWRLKLKKIQRI